MKNECLNLIGDGAFLPETDEAKSKDIFLIDKEEYEIILTRSKDGGIKLKSEIPLGTGDLLTCSMVLLREIKDRYTKDQLMEIVEQVLNGE